MMVVLSMSRFLIEKLDIVRRPVYGGWCMKRGMVCVLPVMQNARL